tara:strand:+ start:51 stop:314 length:264 start_codon:yes stop_codon:yes gene_type:complete
MESKNRKSESIENLMVLMKKKLSKLKAQQYEFVNCLSNFSSISLRFYENLKETNDLLICIVDHLDDEKNDFDHQKIEFLRNCLKKDI